MKIAVLILCWNGEAYLEKCLSSLRRLQPCPAEVQIILVDNGSTDRTLERIPPLFPEVQVIPLQKNLGFAGGNNVGLKYALDNHFDCAILLNQDTEVDPHWLNALLLAAESCPDAAAVQSAVFLMDRPDIVNTIGNPINILGFGYSGGYAKPAAEYPYLSRVDPIEVPSASGASLLLRVKALEQCGFFDDAFFVYNEDLDLCWRLRVAGYSIYLAPASVVYHQYEYSRNKKKMFYMERNRWFALLKNYRLGTLLLISPLLALFEIFMIFYAAMDGWFLYKLESIVAIWKNLPEIIRKRKEVQRLRKRKDREVIRVFTPVQEMIGSGHPFVRLGNLLLTICWVPIRAIIFW